MQLHSDLKHYLDRFIPALKHRLSELNVILDRIAESSTNATETRQWLAGHSIETLKNGKDWCTSTEGEAIDRALTIIREMSGKTPSDPLPSDEEVRKSLDELSAWGKKWLEPAATKLEEIRTFCIKLYDELDKPNIDEDAIEAAKNELKASLTGFPHKALEDLMNAVLKDGTPSPTPIPPVSEEDPFPIGICEIVFFAANPADTVRVELNKEWREIEAQILAAKYRDNLKLIPKWEARPDDLLDALNRHDATIIHFGCHGSTADEIILAGSDGQSKLVSKDAMISTLKALRGKIRLVILNACFTLPQAIDITEHIDCAIGMNKAISDEAAIVFARSVYRAIGKNWSVQEAFDQGIAALLLEGIPEEHTPELLCKEGVDPKQVYLLSSH